MISIVDYGLGNIRAFLNIYERLNIKVKIAKNKFDLKGAEKIILPGVGAFDSGMRQLNDSGLRSALDEAVLARRVPVAGICLGMQLMTSGSDEGSIPGLGWISPRASRFTPWFGEV